VRIARDLVELCSVMPCPTVGGRMASDDHAIPLSLSILAYCLGIVGPRCPRIVMVGLNGGLWGGHRRVAWLVECLLVCPLHTQPAPWLPQHYRRLCRLKPTPNRQVEVVGARMRHFLMRRCQGLDGVQVAFRNANCSPALPRDAESGGQQPS
jgi:hypothetical protein